LQDQFDAACRKNFLNAVGHLLADLAPRFGMAFEDKERNAPPRTGNGWRRFAAPRGLTMQEISSASSGLRVSVNSAASHCRFAVAALRSLSLKCHSEPWS